MRLVSSILLLLLLLHIVLLCVASQQSSVPTSLQGQGTADLVILDSVCSPIGMIQSQLLPSLYATLCQSLHVNGGADGLNQIGGLYLWQEQVSQQPQLNQPPSPSTTISQLLPCTSYDDNYFVWPNVPLSQTSLGTIYFVATTSLISNGYDANFSMIYSYQPTIINGLIVPSPLNFTILPSLQCQNVLAGILMPLTNDTIMLLACSVSVSNGQASSMYRFNLTSQTFIDSVEHPLLTVLNDQLEQSTLMFTIDVNDILITSSNLYRLNCVTLQVEILDVSIPYECSPRMIFQDRIAGILLLGCSFGSNVVMWTLDSETGQPIISSNRTLVDWCDWPFLQWNSNTQSLYISCEDGIGSMLLLQGLMNEDTLTTTVLFNNDVCQTAILVFVDSSVSLTQYFISCANYGIYRTRGHSAFLIGPNICQPSADEQSTSIAFDSSTGTTFLTCYNDFLPLPYILIAIGGEDKAPQSQQTMLTPSNNCSQPLDITYDVHRRIIYLVCTSQINWGLTIMQLDVASLNQTILVEYETTPTNWRVALLGDTLYFTFISLIQRWNSSLSQFEPVVTLPGVLPSYLVTGSEWLFFVDDQAWYGDQNTIYAIPQSARNDTAPVSIWGVDVNSSQVCNAMSPLASNVIRHAIYFACDTFLYRIDVYSFQVTIEFESLPLDVSGSLIWDDLKIDVTNQLLYFGVFGQPYSLFVYDIAERLIQSLTIPFIIDTSSINDILPDPLTQSLLLRVLGDSEYSRTFVVTTGFSCTQGYEWQAGECVQCRVRQSRGIANSTQSRTQLPQCQSCSPGSIAPTLGWSECHACEEGKFSNAHIGQVCSPCGVGNYSSSPGQTECQQCMAGRYADVGGMSECLECRVGRASSSISAETCDFCLPGRFMNVTGATECHDCLPGYSQSNINSTECISCPSGSYSASHRATVCLPCVSGTFTNHSDATVCYDCEPGSAQSQINSTSCHPCAPGSYSSSKGQTVCFPCAPGSASNETGRNSICQACSPGRQAINASSTSCTECPLGWYSASGSQCEVCQIDTYSPDIGLPCVTCTDSDQEGLQCRNGLVSVIAGWWPYLENTTINGTTMAVYLTTRCPEDYCHGAQLQLALSAASNSSTSLIPTLCQWPRLNSPDNWLCADCVDGYIAWGSSCQECQHANIGLILGALVLSCVLVYLLYRIDPSSSPLTILVFFIQISALELGSVTRWIDWIQFANFGSHSFSTCLAPLTPSQQMILTLCIPFILLVILGILCLIHWSLSRCFSQHHESVVVVVGQQPRSEEEDNINGSCSCSCSSCSYLCLPFQRLAHLSVRLLRWLSLDYNRDRYVGGSIAILIFCYTSTVVTVVKSLHCIEIAPHIERLFQVPTIDCHSSEYHLRLLPAIYCWLIVYVCGLPIFIFVFVWRSWHRVVAWSDEDIRDKTNNNIDNISHSQSIDHSFSLGKSKDKGYLSTGNVDEEGAHEENSSHSLSHTRSPSLIAFNHRWGHFYRPYRLSAWYWQPLEMLQRFIFALISVLFIESPYVRNSIYTLLNLISLIGHIASCPFADDRMNHVNSISYLLLSFISLLMIAQHTPYTLGTQIVFFLLVVPFSAILLIWGIRFSLLELRSKKFRSASSHRSLNNANSLPSHDHALLHPDADSEEQNSQPC